MTLDDFERSLAEEKRAKDVSESTGSGSRKRRKHHHYHHHHHRRCRDEEDNEDQRSKLSERSYEDKSEVRNSFGSGTIPLGKGEDEWVEKSDPASNSNVELNIHEGPGRPNGLMRDAWMVEQSASGIEYIHKDMKVPSTSSKAKSPKADFELKIHDTELNKHHLQDLADGKDVPNDVAKQPAQHSVDYVFGDSGAQWRMTKLKAIYRRAEESGADVDDIATEQYGDMRAFDDAREEEIELGRRETYGEGYVGKEKPSGELFEERKLESGIRRDREQSDHAEDVDQDPPREMETEPAPRPTVQLDQSALNRLKAQLMKAKLNGPPYAVRLESEYNEALRQFPSDPKPHTVVLGAMDNRMLAGGQRGEIKPVDTKRGRERGLVGENEDMSIQDMVREERRTRNQTGGDSQRFAERIAKDTKFDVSFESACLCRLLLKTLTE